MCPLVSLAAKEALTETGTRAPPTYLASSFDDQGEGGVTPSEDTGNAHVAARA